MISKFGWFVKFVRAQWTPLPDPKSSFAGQTIIITASNTGLGLEAARYYTKLSAKKVILAVRTESKGEVAKQDIEATTNRKDVVEVWKVDLESFKSVRLALAQKHEHKILDAVVENAGVQRHIYEEVGGFESTITINVIPTFLMALLLLPKLREITRNFSTIPRLTIISSDLYEIASFSEKNSPKIFDTYRERKSKTNIGMDRYITSKLLELLVVRRLAQALSTSGKPQIILNTLSPGFCHSELGRTTSLPQKIGNSLFKAVFARKTEVGARTFVAASSAGLDSHGQYMSECKIMEPGNWVLSAEGEKTQIKVYDELMEILEGIQPGIGGNL